MKGFLKTFFFLFEIPMNRFKINLSFFFFLIKSIKIFSEISRTKCMDLKFQGLRSKGETGIIAWAAKQICLVT